MKPMHYKPARERGAVLVISLILLMIMTILAVTMSQTSTLQQRMAGNARDADAAFQSAEAGLRAAEIALKEAPTVNPCDDLTTCLSNNKDAYSAVNFSTTDFDWWDDNAVEFGTVGTQDLTHVADDPHYVVAVRDEIKDSLNVDAPVRVYYEVTSYANGTTDTAAAVTQSVYAKWELH